MDRRVSRTQRRDRHRAVPRATGLRNRRVGRCDGRRRPAAGDPRRQRDDRGPAPPATAASTCSITTRWWRGTAGCRGPIRTKTSRCACRCGRMRTRHWPTNTCGSCIRSRARRARCWRSISTTRCGVGSSAKMGPTGIRIGVDYPGSAYLALQRQLKALRRRGVLLAICSKNNAARRDGGAARSSRDAVAAG